MGGSGPPEGQEISKLQILCRAGASKPHFAPSDPLALMASPSMSNDAMSVTDELAELLASAGLLTKLDRDFTRSSNPGTIGIEQTGHKSTLTQCLCVVYGNSTAELRVVCS